MLTSNPSVQIEAFTPATMISSALDRMKPLALAVLALLTVCGRSPAQTQVKPAVGDVAAPGELERPGKSIANGQANRLPSVGAGHTGSVPLVRQSAAGSPRAAATALTETPSPRLRSAPDTPARFPSFGRARPGRREPARASSVGNVRQRWGLRTHSSQARQRYPEAYLTKTQAKRRPRPLHPRTSYPFISLRTKARLTIITSAITSKAAIGPFISRPTA